MEIVEHEIGLVQKHDPSVGSSPNYNRDNPIWGVIHAIEDCQLASGLDYYWADSRQYLFPFEDLALTGPSGDDWETADPTAQDNKNDFQKQNVRDYKLRGISAVRGYATAGDWIGSFLRISYQPTDGSPLLGTDGTFPGESVRMYIKVGDTGKMLDVPYHPEAHSYDIEIWGFSGENLRSLLDAKGKAAFDRGELAQDTDLVRGSYSDFAYEEFDAARENAVRKGYSALTLLNRSPDHTMHPIRPLHLELAWANPSETVWDSQSGGNYHLEFNMAFRGWRNYHGVGVSPNPHGGVGFLEFRNLFSNYFGYEEERRQTFGEDVLPELGRDMREWNFDADAADIPPGDRKPPNDPRKPNPLREAFMAVDYMDLHILNPNCGIGIHRHRDNQEVFLMLKGKGLMIVGDWCQFSGRMRAFEVRTMLEGDLTLCKTGQLHALINPLDEPVQLFMFGGYD